MHKHQIVLQLALLTSVLVLSGCVNPGKNMMPKDTGPTMAQIYNRQTGIAPTDVTFAQDGTEVNTTSSAPAAPAQITNSQDAPLSNVDYTMTSQNQVNQVFKMLPNPTIAVYIFPHMTQFQGTDVPVPGYTTAFFLYEKNHYAMPGEIY